MFAKTTFFSCLLIALFFCFFIAKFFIPRSSDYSFYRTLRSSEKPEEAPPDSVNFFSTKQIKEGVTKEIWLPTEEGRINYLLKNRISTVTLLDRIQQVELVEEMEGIKCWMQDRLYREDELPMQQIRYFEAEQGVYQYNQETFLADQVNLSIFRLPGHALVSFLDPHTPYLKGAAKHVSFSLSEKSPKFQADHFKAYLKEGG